MDETEKNQMINANISPYAILILAKTRTIGRRYLDLVKEMIGVENPEQIQILIWMGQLDKIKSDFCMVCEVNDLWIEKHKFEAKMLQAYEAMPVSLARWTVVKTSIDFAQENIDGIEGVLKSLRAMLW